MNFKKRLPIFLFGTAILFGTSAPLSSAQMNEETQVREYFADIPVMIEIARCESKFRQFTDAGNVLRGGYNDGMIGVFQFHEQIHRARAQTLGYDLATLDGNLAYARHLYNQSGTEPWNSSRACFETTSSLTTVVNTAAETAELSDKELLEKIALLKQVISLLQLLLTLQQG